PGPLVPAKAGTQIANLDSRFRGNERKRCVDSNGICSNITRTLALSSTPSQLHPMSLPLSGLLVVSLEQAVAAPMCTCRLADAGARVIRVERPEGDFARDKLSVPRAAMGAKRAATESIAIRSERAVPASPPPFTREGQGGGMQQGSRVQAHPLPHPPPPAGGGGDPPPGEGAHRAGGGGQGSSAEHGVRGSQPG